MLELEELNERATELWREIDGWYQCPLCEPDPAHKYINFHRLGAHLRDDHYQEVAIMNQIANLEDIPYGALEGEDVPW